MAEPEPQAEPARAESTRRRREGAPAGGAMDDLVRHVQELRDERDRLRSALERMREAIGDAV